MNRQDARILALELLIGVIGSTYAGECDQIENWGDAEKVQREMEEIEAQLVRKLKRAHAAIDKARGR